MTDLLNKKFQWKIILFIIIILFFFFLGNIIYFKTKCDMAKENPLKYAAKEYDIESCTCFTNKGEGIIFNQTSAKIYNLNAYQDLDINKNSVNKDGG